jgi:hypothetical protein
MLLKCKKKTNLGLLYSNYRDKSNLRCILVKYWEEGREGRREGGSGYNKSSQNFG